MQLQILRTLPELRSARAALRKRGETLALVPTMGALHEGHLALMREARKRADRVMASIFVNPRQFGPNEDLARYPRPFEADAAKLEAEGVDYLYAPTPEDIYPPGFCIAISVHGIGQELEGAHRPGFFDSVATVVTKFFLRIQPDFALFGEKDYQQLLVIKRLAKDLDLPVEVIGMPTVREKLALSSRNAYLTSEQRQTADALYETLCDAAAQLKHATPAPPILENAESRLIAAGFAKVDYLELRDAETLAPLTAATRHARLLAAAWLGTTRLIDNVEVITCHGRA